MGIEKCEFEIGLNKMELNEHGTTSFPIAIYKDDLKLNFIPWHWHEELEFVIVLKNKLNVRIGTEKYIIEKGNGIFINSGTLHYFCEYEKQQSLLKSIVFHPRLIGGNSNSIFWDKYLRPILTNLSLTHVILDNKIEWQQDILNTINQTYNIFMDKPEGYEFLVRNYLSSIIYKIFKKSSNKIVQTSLKSIRYAIRSKKMLNFISKNYSSPITVGMIANDANISQSEVLRCFKETTGTTPMQYIINFRLQRASELLISSHLKIIDIAFECGFEETSYFTKKFKNKYQITPSQYRHNNKDKVCCSS